MKQKLFSIFFTLALLLPANVCTVLAQTVRQPAPTETLDVAYTTWAKVIRFSDKNTYNVYLYQGNTVVAEFYKVPINQSNDLTKGAGVTTAIPSLATLTEKSDVTYRSNSNPKYSWDVDAKGPVWFYNNGTKVDDSFLAPWFNGTKTAYSSTYRQNVECYVRYNYIPWCGNIAFYYNGFDETGTYGSYSNKTVGKYSIYIELYSAFDTGLNSAGTGGNNTGLSATSYFIQNIPIVARTSNTSTTSSSYKSPSETGDLTLTPQQTTLDENSTSIDVAITSTSVRQMVQRTSKIDNSTETLRLTAQKGTATSSDKQYTVTLDFVLDQTFYNAQYIPTGTYDIKSSGTPRVMPANGKGYLVRYQYNPIPSAITEVYSNYGTTYTEMWFLNSGTVRVINPNHDTYPMYVSVDGKSMANKAAKAKFWSLSEPSIYTISAEDGGMVTATPYYSDAAVEGSNNLQYYSGTTNVTIEATPNPGYTFDKWSDNNNSAKRTNLTINTSYTAYFIANHYTVTLDQASGTGGSSSVSATYNAAMPSATMPTRDGYTFEGYFDGENGTGTQYYNADGTSARTWNKTDNNTTLYAHWTVSAPPTYTLGTWSTNDGTITVAGTAAGSYEEGTSLTAPTVTKTGYTFVKWRDVTNGVDFSGSMPANDVTYTAQWEINKYTVTVNTNPSGYGTVRIGSGAEQAQVQIADVPHFSTFTTPSTGTIVINGNTVTATPATVAGYTYTFQNWTNALATVTDDMDVIANFTRSLIPYTITYNLNDGTNPVSPAPATSYNVETTTITLPTPTKEGYNFLGWYANSDLTTGGVVTTIPVGSYGNKEFWAKWEAKTYAITYNAGANGTGTIAAGEKTYNVNFTLSSSTFTREGYTQTGWSINADGSTNDYTLGDTYTGNTALTLYPYWEINTYDITFKNADGTTLKKSDGTTDAVYSVAYSATPAYDGATPTKAADSEYTYTFNAWSPAITSVTGAATYTATYSTTKVQYTLTWDVNGGNTLTGTYTNGTMDWGTAITKPADPTKSGYTFTGWDADNDGTADDVAATMPTSDVTYKALWTAASPNITLCENCNDAHYNTFKATYGGSAGVGVNVTYNRQFTASRWSTMCLPFSLDLATMIANKMYGCVYEFKYATGNANVGSGVNLYFSNAKSIEAGKCYIVNANADLAAKESFVFSNVTIDVTADKVKPLNSVTAYNGLAGYKSQGTIELVGTLRNGTLQGSAKDNTYMGLKNNKIYYPNTDTGSTIWAYRGIFRSSEILDKESMQKMRIIVDGEDRGELIIDEDGEILNAGGDAQSRKFIENGVLYIEREGVIYDAQGKRIK